MMVCPSNYSGFKDGMFKLPASSQKPIGKQFTIFQGKRQTRWFTLSNLEVLSFAKTLYIKESSSRFYE